MMPRNQALVLLVIANSSPYCPPAQLERASTASRLSAVVFIYRFGALLSNHLHFHCVVVMTAMLSNRPHGIGKPTGGIVS